MNNEMSYAEAIAELETIVSEIEQDDVPVDELLEKVKRASDLITFCKAKLTKTEDEVHTVLESIQEKEPVEADDAESEESSAESQVEDEQQAQSEEDSDHLVQEDEPENTDESREEESDEEVPF
ncbi:MAG: exodeoxyribonuclease VII small subunit [Bacteroidota bacterium]